MMLPTLIPPTALPHLTELRTRVLWVVAAWLGFTVLAFVWRVPLLAWLLAPATAHLTQGLLATGVLEVWLTHFQLSLVAGLLLALPVLAYHLWRFLAPGLTGAERTMLARLAMVAFGLLILGALIARWLILPSALGFLLGLQQPGVTVAPKLSETTSFILTLTATISLLTCLPIVLWGLLKVGLVNLATLQRQRRGVILGILATTAVLTPSPDPLTMLLAALPLYGLFELTLLCAPRRRL